MMLDDSQGTGASPRPIGGNLAWCVLAVAGMYAPWAVMENPARGMFGEFVQESISVNGWDSNMTMVIVAFAGILGIEARHRMASRRAEERERLNVKRSRRPAPTSALPENLEPESRVTA